VHAGPGAAASEAIVDPMRIESRLQDDLDATIRLIAERLVPLPHTLAREAQVEVNYEMTKAEASRQIDELRQRDWTKRAENEAPLIVATALPTVTAQRLQATNTGPEAGGAETARSSYVGVDRLDPPSSHARRS
jgi:hypothetical protein